MAIGLIAGIGLLGAVGAILRGAIGRNITAASGGRFPWGTVTVNLTGAFALGALHGAGVDGTAMKLLAIGLIGSYTTFSGWMLETLQLATASRRRALACLVGSIIAGLAFSWLGSELAGIMG